MYQKYGQCETDGCGKEVVCLALAATQKELEENDLLKQERDAAIAKLGGARG